jgi:hypothetical protein
MNHHWRKIGAIILTFCLASAALLALMLFVVSPSTSLGFDIRHYIDLLGNVFKPLI